MKPHLQCAEQQVSRSNLTKYCACHAERLTYLVLITYETSFTVRGATGVTIQPHQILRLPRKIALQNFWRNLWKQMKRHFQCGDDPRMIRPWSDHKNANRNPPRKWGYFSSSPRAFSIVKYNISRPILLSNLHQILRLPRKVTLDLHQLLRLPRKVTLELHQVLCLPRKVTLDLHQVLHLPPKVTLELHQVLHLPRKVTLELHQMLRLSRRKTHMLNPHHISNLIYNAGSNRCHPPTSPNAAPATKNDTATFQRKCPKTDETSFPMRGRSENDPTMIREWSDHKNANRNPPRKWGYFSSSPRAFSIVKYNISRPILLSNLHQILRLPRKVTLALHQILRLPRKVTLALHEVLHATKSDTWPSPSTAPATKSDTWTSPNTAPATKSDTSTSRSTAPATKNDTLPLLYCTQLYWTLLLSTLLNSTLLYCNWTTVTELYSTLLYSTLLYWTLLNSTIQYCTEL